jgi:aminopeptidase N
MSLRRAASIFLCALACVPLAPAEEQRTRLPVGITEPVSYDLTFMPTLKGAGSTFTGRADIVVDVRTNTETVTLNLKDLTVTNVSITDVRTGKDVAVKDVRYRVADEQVEILTIRPLLQTRRYRLSIQYGGAIRTDMTGLYLSSYQESNETR